MNKENTGMDAYFGPVEILSIENSREFMKKDKPEIPVFLEMNDRNVRFIYYSDCQQLIIMLPNDGREYGMFRLWGYPDRILLEDVPAGSRLNGDVQILYDTLPLTPGSYAIEINLITGLRHIISFIKHVEGNFPKIRYGENFIARKVEKQTGVSGPRIEYEGTLRAGTVTYIDGDTRIRFDHEMGGGNCLAYIFIPDEQKWEQQTKTPLADRDGILRFVAETIKAEQASSTRIEITDSQISFFY